MSHLRAIKLGLHWNNESRQCPYRLIKHLYVVAWVSSSGKSTEWYKIIRPKSMGHRAAMIFDWISKEIWTWWTLQLMTDVSFFEIVISFSRTFIRNLDLLFWRRTNFEALFFGELYFQRIKNQLIPILVHAQLLYGLEALCHLDVAFKLSKEAVCSVWQIQPGHLPGEQPFNVLKRASDR